MHTYVDAYIHKYVHTYIHTYIRTHTLQGGNTINTFYILAGNGDYNVALVCTYVPAFLHAHVHPYIPTYIHTYVHNFVPYVQF